MSPPWWPRSWSAIGTTAWPLLSRRDLRLQCDGPLRQIGIMSATVHPPSGRRAHDWSRTPLAPPRSLLALLQIKSPYHLLDGNQLRQLPWLVASPTLAAELGAGLSEGLKRQEALHEALRGAVARCVAPFTRADGSIDFDAARARYGIGFDQLVLQVRTAPVAPTHLTLAQLLSRAAPHPSSAFATAEAILNERLSVAAGARAAVLPSLPVGRHPLPSPDFRPATAPGPVTGLMELLKRRDVEAVLPRAVLPARIAALPGADVLQTELRSWFARVPFGSGDAVRLAVANVAVSGQARAGPAFAALLGALDAAPHQQPTRQSADNLLQRGAERAGAVSPHLLAALVSEHQREPMRMELLEKVNERFGESLETHALATAMRGHLFASTEGLVSALGLSPAHSLLLGKRYSTNTIVESSLRQKGFTALDVLDLHPLPGVSVDEMMEAYRRESSDRSNLMPSTITSVLPGWAEHVRREHLTPHLIDDGAELIRAMCDEYPDLAARCTAVEQTRFGANALRHLDLPMPVINVAEAPVKLHLEAVLVGWSVVAEMSRVLEELEAKGIPRGHRVALVGYGSNGETISRLLEAQGFTVDVIDERLDRRRAAAEAGFSPHADAREVLAHADYVLGATGSTPLDQELLEHTRDGAVFISASSSTVEFAVQGERVGFETTSAIAGQPLGTFRGQVINLGDDGAGHGLAVIKTLEKEFLVANQFDPVNFTGSKDPIAAELIQLTRALLQLASLQARRLEPGAKGLIALDAEGQRFIATEWLKIVDRLGSRVPPLVKQMLHEAYERAMRELPPA